MNERLIQLYRASRPKEALVSQDEYKSANVLLGSDVDKFADLIIKECAQVLWTLDDGELHSEYVNLLKKHFGVE